MPPRRISRSSVSIFLLVLISPVLGFGTINRRHQNSEHEKITRDALGCAPGVPSNGDCFEPISLDQVAGSKGEFGAVGAPDNDEFLSSVAHCDDADYIDYAKFGVNGTYPRLRSDRDKALTKCITHLAGRFKEGVLASYGLFNKQGGILKKETNLDNPDPTDPDPTGAYCDFFANVQFGGRAKCNTIEGFGRALHGAQDFYSHSNWVDEATSAQPISITNPPGLRRSGISDLMDLGRHFKDVRANRNITLPAVPADLSTGCYLPGPLDPIEGARRCISAGRLPHKDLNKDEGQIQVVPGVSIPSKSPLTSKPETSRGKIGNNFEVAVQAAILETRRQWKDFRAELITQHGRRQGALAICALTRDHPWIDCTGRKVAVVIDSSGSNEETDPSNLRIEAGKEFVSTLVKKDAAQDGSLPDFVTVIDFDDSARVVYPLGDPAAASFDGIDSSGGTSIASGIDLAVEQLTSDKDGLPATKDHSGIVVFTDGQDSNIGALVASIQAAGKLGIRVSIGFLSVSSLQPVNKRRWWQRVRRQSDATAPSADVLAAIISTGGVFGTIGSADAQHSFVSLVEARGVTNIDNIGTVNGGPLFPNVTVTALATGDADVYTYNATAGQNLTFEAKAVSGQPMLNVTLLDTSSGETLGNAETADGADIANLVYQPTADTELEFVVTATPIEGTNTTSLYSVELKVTESISGEGMNTTCGTY